MASTSIVSRVSSFVALALLLLACAVQLHQCFKVPDALKLGKMGKPSGPLTPEQEEAERWKAAKGAFKGMFAHSSKLSDEEVLAKLEALEPYYGDAKIHMPVDYRQLRAFHEASAEKCDQLAYLNELRKMAKSAKSEFPALRGYLEGALERQLAMCNFEDQFKARADAFQRNFPQEWKLIEDFNHVAGMFGIRPYEWRDHKFLDNGPQMNEALTRMFEEKVQSGEFAGHEIQQKVYNLANELIGACKSFSESLGPSAQMVTINPKRVKKNNEMLDWMRYLNICGQVERTNFEKSLGQMFTKYSMPGFNEAWEKYEDWRERWV